MKKGPDSAGNLALSVYRDTSLHASFAVSALVHPTAAKLPYYP
jgi:hypothetical protein